jgi:transporter family-2 protein
VALPSQPYFYLGGAIGVVFIGITAVVVREIGVLLMGLGSIAGQLLMALILDFFFPSAQVTGVMILIGASLAFVAAAWAAWPKKKLHAHVAEGTSSSGE